MTLKPKEDFNFAQGEILLFDKPLEWTSFDVVKKVRNAIKIKKVGHAGTLDPLATGLLILCTGKMTKRINEIQGQEKEYIGEMVLGKTTPSFDLETDFDSQTDISHLTLEEVKQAFSLFQGIIEQVPPVFSAVKKDGKRAYESARKGKKIELEARQVEIKAFEPLVIDLPTIQFRVVCSKGTYIRSLVRDFGEALKVGAYMSALRRSRIGEYSVSNAYSIDSFISLVKN